VNVEPIECLSDNYAYLLWQNESRDALVVDPSEGEPVWRALETHDLHLVGILCTHHHWDHVGGVEALCRKQPELFVYCSDYDVPRIKGATRGFAHAQAFECCGLHFECLQVPGHTLGALAYSVEGAVFTGDTLFGAGCGRLFEGTPKQMYESLTRLAALDGGTKVYFGHEYTRGNLTFARSLEPNHAKVVARLESSAHGRTTPSTIDEERETNPFLRCSEVALKQALGPRFELCEPHEVFAELRRRKDDFRA
jgi:hydroxyacylglutathione hydrolase